MVKKDSFIFKKKLAVNNKLCCVTCSRSHEKKDGIVYCNHTDMGPIAFSEKRKCKAYKNDWEKRKKKILAIVTKVIISFVVPLAVALFTLIIYDNLLPKIFPK